MFDSVKKILVVSSFLLAINVSYADTSAMDCVKQNGKVTTIPLRMYVTIMFL
jgi:hypothetical protein